METKEVSSDIGTYIKKRIEADGLDWVAGDTSVSSLPVEDKKKLCGAIISASDSLMPMLTAPMRLKVDPTVFDWHDRNGKDYMTPVKNQGQCGSCWAFGVIGTIEAQINIEKKDPNFDVDLSEQYLVSKCCSAGDCGGGYPTGALAFIKSTGVPDESCYPYKAKNDECNPCDKYHPYKIKNFSRINPTTSDYKWALQEYGPMCVVIKVPEDWFYYKSGVYVPTWTSNKFGWANHCVVLCGWDDNKKAWRIKNSWGEYWGDHGYAWVKFGNIEKYNYGYIVEDPIIPAPPDPLSPIYTLTISIKGNEFPIQLPLDGIAIEHNDQYILRWSSEHIKSSST